VIGFFNAAINGAAQCGKIRAEGLATRCAAHSTKVEAHGTSDCEFIRTHFNASRIAMLRNGVVRARATNDAAR